MALDLKLNTDRFLQLLERLIGETQYLQNNPPEQNAEEDRAGQHVLELLRPHSVEEGGPLVVEHVSYVEGRGNIIVTYPGSGEGVVSFVGSHLDVVPADPARWERDPFKLIIEGDKLFGRGTTDCLGHVALLTDLMIQLAETKPALNRSVVVVFIANEENALIGGIGVDELMKQGKIDRLKAGPLYWVDSADKHPTIGTGSMSGWTLEIEGKLFHSGLPHMGINALELGMEALGEIQRRFYQMFPAKDEEAVYGFPTPSTMKPTVWSYPGGSVNQIPGAATIKGDIRITPFYDIWEVRKQIEAMVAEVGANLDSLPKRGPASHYSLPDEGRQGSLKFSWMGEPFAGIACDLESEGYKQLAKATEQVLGHCEPISMTGSLPLVKDLQNYGFDVQIVGFGREDTYHAPNEFALLSDFQQATEILSTLIDGLDQ